MRHSAVSTEWSGVHMRKARKGQYTLEYTALIGILLVAFGFMLNYVKSGIAGRYRADVDTFLGGNYAP
jgi:vacuolar-type H+-ATPase subunit I/STV1